MKHTNRGFTLIEIIGVLALGSMLLIGLTAMVDTALEDSKGQQAAFYQAQVASAAAKYIEDKPGDLGTKTAAGPYVLTLADLRGSYLPVAFADSNIYGQTPCVVVKRRNAAFADKFDALVIAAGATKIGEKDIASVAANAGLGGGYIKQETATTSIAQGASWNLNAASLQGFAAPGCLAGNESDAGHLASAIFYDAGQASADFLYRNKVPGRPELNKMNTPVFLTGTAVAQTSQPDICDPTVNATWGSVTTDSEGAVLSCVKGMWERQEGRYWKEPVGHINDFSDPSKVNPVDNRIGDVRMERWHKRAYTWDGFKWIPLALDDNGRLTATDILITRQEKAGATCKTEDVIGTVVIEKTTGAILSCQSNVWTTQSGLHPRADLSSSATWVVLPSKNHPVSDLPPVVNYPDASQYGYDMSSAWTYATMSTAPIQPGKDGLVVVHVQSTMDRQQPYPDALKYPDPTLGGQFEIAAQVRDLDTNKLIGTPTRSRSGKLRNEAITINATLVQALPKNNAGYVIDFVVRWTTFQGSDADNRYSESSWGDSFGNVVYQTPLTLTYNIDVNT